MAWKTIGMLEHDIETHLKKKRISGLITAIGNFSVQYNFQSISIALIVMSASVCTLDDDHCKDGEQQEWVKSTASAVVFAGAVCGQLSMGYAGDLLGRNTAMIITLSLVAIGALLSAVASQGSAATIYTVIIIARFFLGFGAGGIYPLSATKAAEDAVHGGGEGVDVIAAAKSFFWQVPGTMGPWLLALIFAYSPGISVDTQWRLLLGLGAIPSVLVVILTAIEQRLTPNPAIKDISPALQESILVDDDETVVPSSSEGDRNGLLQNAEDSSSSSKESIWSPEYLKELVATGGGWFLYDIAYYGVNLFGGEIVSEINETDDDNVSSMSSIQQITFQELIGLSMGIPACLATIYLLQHFSTKQLQIYGFVFIAFCFVILAILFATVEDQQPELIYVVYCLLLFSLSFGPNVTTYVLPAQTFPKRVRGTYNGISAALGKIGAMVGVYMFGPVSDATNYPTVMGICAMFSILGAILSYLYIK